MGLPVLTSVYFLITCVAIFLMWKSFDNVKKNQPPLTTSQTF